MLKQGVIEPASSPYASPCAGQKEGQHLRSFEVKTDHTALTWLKRTPDPIVQQARWLEQLEEYTICIEHWPGIRHGNADAMSRRPCPKKDCVCKEE